MSELYQLPDGWEWKKLGCITTTTSGGTPSRSNSSYWGGKIKWLKSGELNDDYIDEVEECITELGLQNSSAKLFRKNTLLIAMYGATVGRLGLLNVETTTNQAICAILNDKGFFDNRYIFFYLLSIRKKMLKDSFGGAQPNLSQAYIKNLDIPLPPLTEQKRIVQKLDALFERIDKAIALLQKNIDAADNFMNSVLNDVFSNLEQNYNKRSVDELCIKITDGTHATPNYTDSGIPFLSVKDISNGVINFSNTRFISLEEHQLLSKRCNVEKNDILYTKVGTTGIAKVVDVDNEFSIFVSIALLKPRHDVIYNMFFQYMLNSPNCYSQAQKLTRGVANRNLVLKDIKGIIFPIPSYDVQRSIVTYLDEVSAKIAQVKSAQQQKLQGLLNLKSSILDQAFHGKL